MRKQFLILVLMGILGLDAARAFAQTTTVVMRNGDRVRAELIDMDRNFTFNVYGQPLQVPFRDVVLIDFAGDGRNIPVDEISRANAADGYVVMKSGEQFNARLQDVTGRPPIAIFSDGRRSNLRDVARIYLRSVDNVPGFPSTNASGRARSRDRGDRDAYQRRSDAPTSVRSVVVPANVQWTNTGISVTRGQWLRFEPSGEIRLSFNGDDMARAAGAASYRFAEKAQIPTIPAGALIGRIGRGQPFSIGDTTQAFDMPASGRLYLGVNDDHVPDNSGNFVVRVWEP